MGWRAAAGTQLRRTGDAIGIAWQRLVCALANSRRRMMRRFLTDYVVIALDHQIAERSADVPWWYAYVPNLRLPLSLEYLSNALRHIAGDPDARGVIFLCKGQTLSLAQAQSLSALLERFRGWDVEHRIAGGQAKRIIFYLEHAGTAGYVAAASADLIVMPPLASWDLIGLRVAPTYWKETLARLGIHFEAVKVAPWKTAADSYIRSDMSAAEREQYNWLLDSLCDDIVGAIAAGRRLPNETVSELIDRAPLTAEEARFAGLIDAVGYEDQLAEFLEPGQAEETGAAGKATKPRIRTYRQARGLLMRRPRRRQAQTVGVLSLLGAIMMGRSRTFPIPLPIFGERTLGSQTATQAIRAARRNKRLAAVVLHVDSPGGSALASDLIWRELALLGREKPLIVYMGDVAASGGYYVAAPGRKIVAQAATMTGSIGVVTAKPVVNGALKKIDAHREVIRRGDNAGLYAPDESWSAGQRQKVEEGVRHAYHVFKQRVAEGRGLDIEWLDEVANGRVWTGKQAQANGLVDALGDFQVALNLACEAAGLPTDGSVGTEVVHGPRARLMAEPVNAVTEAVKAALGLDALGQARDMAALLPEMQTALRREPYWLIATDLPEIG